MGNKQTFVQKLVTDIVARFGITLAAVSDPSDRYFGILSAEALYQRYGKDVRRATRRMSSATLGRIATTGKGYGTHHGQPGTALYQVHLGTWLGKYDSGRMLLRDIATTALIAAIRDHFVEKQKMAAADAEHDAADIHDEMRLLREAAEHPGISP